ncbi:hypothetical protein [Actinomadura sp. DC4]|uniref:hypothetical protein n=1 Tax=Actinomadura sp. DC4 TaxID=3055069 RepID=UPI0025B18147|nr:hypothetical protein [Actinomadura sp. DC4]MDN3355354.1 hypothetical protein [Actinomadura sp. DC4]
MEGDRNRTALRQELERVESDTEEMRATARQLRLQVGERWIEPTDAAELITAAEEQEAFAEAMEARGEELRKALGEPD